MTRYTVSTKHATAAVTVSVTALIIASWAETGMRTTGLPPELYRYLSYLIALPFMLLLFYPLWRADRTFIRAQFQPSDLNCSVALQAFVLGLCVRIVWWSASVAAISFGLIASNPDQAPAPLSLRFDCGPAHYAILAVVVMAILTPLFEELIYRGYLMTALRHRGALISILGSTLIFTVLHSFDGWPYAFMVGLIMGIQYWLTGSLWPSLITHATVNGLAQIDWDCLNPNWVPDSSDIPIVLPGLISSAICIAALLTISALLVRQSRGTKERPPG